MNIGVILAAGKSSQFGGSMHKQYLKLNGKEVVWYAIKALQQAEQIDDYILVVDELEYNSHYIENKYNVKTILGGNSRNESIYNAIHYVKDNFDCEKIVFIDSVRPFVTKEQIDENLNWLDNYDAVVTISDIGDALVTTEFYGVNRNDYKLVQTPESFRFDKILEFNHKRKDLAIISQFAYLNTKVVKSKFVNMKIDVPEDLFLAEQLMRIDYYSVAHNAQFRYTISPESRVLLLGASGGIGQAIRQYLISNNIQHLAPSHIELDLKNLTVDSITKYCNDFKPNIIINAAATYYDDSISLVETFEPIFNVNVKANLVLIEYARIQKNINIVLLSSSSSTKGRENLTNYSAAKAALNSIVESQARALINDGVYLNAIIPEKVNTPLIEKLHKTNINLRELLDPQDIINVIMYFAFSREYGKLVHVRKGL